MAADFIMTLTAYPSLSLLSHSITALRLKCNPIDSISLLKNSSVEFFDSMNELALGMRARFIQSREKTHMKLKVNKNI